MSILTGPRTPGGARRLAGLVFGSLLIALATLGWGRPQVRLYETAAARGAPTGQASTPSQTCVLIPGGTIYGTVTSGGAPAPDGTYISLILPNAPEETTVVQGGAYSLPILARACADGVHWIGFELWAGGLEQGQAVHGWTSELDLTAPQPITGAAATTSQSGPPALCQLAFGTLSGSAIVGGSPAPDGTAVTAGTGAISQAVLTAAGHYTLTTVGRACDGNAPEFFPMTISALGTSITVTPTSPTAQQDIVASP